ncbi:alpha/beta fold hydrolase [Rhodococcus spongiicola]|uniref:Alpha/beta fold hydrolase n=1 Tax=Rhodococcus spongiicola TaxID=2487352 RepID=A0A3S3BKB9_9NOCA|nr:alpha/beta fold hydrolase [Rhodococcus spongiicola]
MWRQLRTSRKKRLGAMVVTTCAAMTVGTSLLVPASGATPVDDFYVPPVQFDATPGTVVRTEPLAVFATVPASDGAWPVAAEKVLYTSLTQDGDPVAVSGTFIDSAHPWEGDGDRPTVVIAPGTAGQGDQCAMSVAFSTGLYADPAELSLSANQELVSASTWSALGARVFVTDYIGLGTPGIHTYANRVEQAHAVLDAARAANALADAGPSAPVVFWGFSQGGGAVAAAAEMQPTYAPELELRGTWAGAPTADLMSVLPLIDDSNLIGGAVGYAVNGFAERNPQMREYVDELVTPTGRELLEFLSVSCIADVMVKHPFMQSGDLTVDGRPLLEHLDEIPDAVELLRQQRIGTVAPSSPVLITSALNDDTVPYGQARQLAEDWCAQGATVTFRTNPLPPILSGAALPNHLAPAYIDGYGPDSAISYLLDRLNGVPLSGCTFD